MRIFEGITETRKTELLKQLRAMWTHDSTAIKGNTLTLGDTMFVLEYGLTVKGKPLKDQVDVQNHACAVDKVLEIFKRGSLNEEDIFTLHRLVINEQTSDIYKPVGAYKREDSGTYLPTPDGHSVYHAYLPADEVPAAMKKFLEDFNKLYRADADREELIEAYVSSHVAFTSIHPFYDGNGRLARLISNLPVLFAGYPPIVIPSESREDYLKVLWAYEQPAHDLEPLKNLIRASWKTSLSLFEEARKGGCYVCQTQSSRPRHSRWSLSHCRKVRTGCRSRTR